MAANLDAANVPHTLNGSSDPGVGRHEMRLKQLLGVIFLMLFAGAMALAANPQLTNVNVTGQGHATTVLLHANGAFTHTEYRPVDNLLLVDLAGLSAGKLKDTAQSVNKPGVASY